MKTSPLHTFHIPVMGLAYTIDTPIRVAHYGISSVISIMDDDLLEKMNAFYSRKFQVPYQEITQKMHDFRAARITSYLNLVDTLVKQKFEQLKTDISESKSALENYIAFLPNQSEIRKKLTDFLQCGSALKETIIHFIEENVTPGAIDVNIMTKVDKENFAPDGQPLPVIYNDAHAALRGFAQSNLCSSVVLSAGMNPSLYGYFEQFSDFFPDSDNQLKKKIILKVSDFRSAMIQGNYLAKKGLWVSEYRIESGLNCGGHAFATEGYLLGPILEEFKQKKENLVESAFALMTKALSLQEKPLPSQPPELKITVQGGIGTAKEHQFLLDHYGIDAVGWGSPFLLVPEATAVDSATRELLCKAEEEDLFLSLISPLGIPFNSVKGTTNELLKQQRIYNGKSGSSCPKKYLALNKEFSGKAVCTASRKYQEQKLLELNSHKHSMSAADYEAKHEQITVKSCLCVGLSNTALLEHNLPLKGEQQGIVVCPGPNIAYFSKEVSLSTMVAHIYGNENILERKDRPHVFINELKMYVDYLRNEISTYTLATTAMVLKKNEKFRQNLLEGIRYYSELFAGNEAGLEDRESNLSLLERYRNEIEIELQATVAIGFA